MTKHEVLEILKAGEAILRAQGVSRTALFGSVARGEQQADSDIDIMVELDPAAEVTLYDYVGIVRHIEALLGGNVDVVNREGLKPHARPRITADAIYAF